MLIEVMCDKFQNHGQSRGRISFHSGLNTVMGTDTGSNSIGKSTFLMVVDFAFGGVDYVEKLTEVQTELGEHTICFAFQFQDGIHYFSRSSVDYKFVQKCDSNYQPIENGKMSLEQYCNFLLSEYSLNLEGLTFRGAVGRSMRIYKRETLDEEHPLQQAKKENIQDAIKGLLKLTDLYSGVAAQSRTAKDARDKHTTFKKAQSYAYIPTVKNQTEFSKNETRIKELSEKAEELAQKSSGGVLDLDSMQTEKISELQIKLKQLKRQKISLVSQLEAIQADQNLGQKSFQKSYTDLQRFFPSVDIQRIEEIENFHQKMARILKAEFSEEEKHLQTAIGLLDSAIKDAEDEIAKISKMTALSKAVLEEYAAISKELKNLQQANENFNTEKQLLQTAKDYEAELDRLVIQQISAMQETINSKMEEINIAIYEGQKTSPVLTISDSKHYTFFTPKDGGTGTQYRGLIVFDLAMLELTKLPVIVHDSILLKQIEDSAVEKILELYNHSTKQIFISMDKKTAYSEKSQQIMENTTVIQLASGDGALFGKTWNDKTQANTP